MRLLTGVVVVVGEGVGVGVGERLGRWRTSKSRGRGRSKRRSRSMGRGHGQAWGRARVLGDALLPVLVLSHIWNKCKQTRLPLRTLWLIHPVVAWVAREVGSPIERPSQGNAPASAPPSRNRLTFDPVGGPGAQMRSCPPGDHRKVTKSTTRT